MTGLVELLARWPAGAVRERLEAATDAEVERALAADRPREEEIIALLSPAAGERLHRLAARARELTVRHFGRTVTLYAPLYLGNACVSRCRYCGFAAHREVARRTLDDGEIDAEARALERLGIRHVLLVTGDDRERFPPERLAAIVSALRPRFASVCLEVYAMERDEYALLVASGADGLVLYQESYDRDLYALLHPSGPKSRYGYRLGAPWRAGLAGMRRLGLGVLLGLGDPRVDAFHLLLHARWLRRRCWRAYLTLSVPRLRPVPGGWRPQRPVDDRLLVQLVCAYRIALPTAGIVLSTRERAELRDALVPLGVTEMSAGSVTVPGGYSGEGTAEAQFEVADRRSPAEVAAALARRGYEPVWKDWDVGFAAGGRA